MRLLEQPVRKKAKISKRRKIFLVLIFTSRVRKSAQKSTPSGGVEPGIPNQIYKSLLYNKFTKHCQVFFMIVSTQIKNVRFFAKPSRRAGELYVWKIKLLPFRNFMKGYLLTL